MTIDVNGNADTVMSELITDICQRFPRLNELARIGVPNVMHPNFSELCLFNGFVKNSFPPVIHIQRRTGIADVNPLGNFSLSFIHSFDLPLVHGVFQDLGKLS